MLAQYRLGTACGRADLVDLQGAGLAVNCTAEQTSSQARAELHAAYGRYAICVKRQLFLAYLETTEDVTHPQLDDLRQSHLEASRRLQACREEGTTLARECEGRVHVLIATHVACGREVPCCSTASHAAMVQ
jgi:hypothetical protein